MRAIGYILRYMLAAPYSAFGGELAKRGNRGPLTLRDGHSADSGASKQTSRVSNPDLTSALTLR